jgi:hypothetical protein
MAASSFEKIPGVPSEEIFRINFNKKSINGTVRALSFIDNDTKQHVIYIPSLELSGYGDTLLKAEELLRTSIHYFCDYLISLSKDKAKKELTALGWNQKQLKNKEYSKAYVDASGILKNFNAVSVREAAFAL